MKEPRKGGGLGEEMQIEKTYGQMMVEAAHMANDRGWDVDSMAHMIAFACGFDDESVARDIEEARILLGSACPGDRS